jgi:integrase/recombinase XerD
MSRTVTQRKKKAQPEIGLAIMMREYLNALLVQNYSVNTIENREFLILQFIQWCIERGLAEPVEVTRPVLERYQRYLFLYRKKNGEPMSFRSQHSRLVPLRMWFRWLTRRNHLLHNPASELELPRLGQPLPKNIFSAQEVERILQLCDIDDPIGLRDRAIIEVLYSTGVRRMEVIALKLYDLSLDRGVVLVRQGKGKKDRYVPIGGRAIAWLQKYIEEARPQLALEPDDMTVFLTASGEPFSRDHMTSNVKARIDAAKLGKTGACHLFRHTMATLMHENGADIRFIQEILGHVKLETTQIYTHVSIRTLQQVHATTHPAAHLGRNETLSAKAMSPDAEKLFAVLRSEAEDDAESA